MNHEYDSTSVLPSPGSPPGMTTSKSSKSSSFQSYASDDASVLADSGHFEDIGLDDDDNATLKSPSSVSVNRALSPKPPGARNLASARPAPRPRRSFPNLHVGNAYNSNPRSTSLTVLADPRSPPLPKAAGSHSTSSLPLSHRNRSPSPGLSGNPRDPSFPPKPRRGSWQTVHRRKSFAELEHECDEDEGDDIPDGLVLDNVPISPRPQHERPPSRNPSPGPTHDRNPKERVRSVGNGTPAVAQAQGSLRSPTWKTDAGIPMRPPASPMTGRVHSWNAALADLSAETKSLTEKLEEHADELDEDPQMRPSSSGRPQTWSASRNSADQIYDKKERVKSTPELPPLRRPNIMIDPLPVSKEKEAVLSRTRPSWLPPKDPAEERRHLREYKKMMAASARAEERRELAKKSQKEVKDSTADNLMQLWENDIIPRWNDAIRERRTRELWWRGVAPRCRGTVWMQAVGNELGLTESSFHAALARARELEARANEEGASAQDLEQAKHLQHIRRDVAEKTWKDLRIFEEGGPLHQNLVDVLSAYAMYRSDLGYVSGCNTIAALLLLNLPSPETSFVTLANVLNRSLPLSFLTYDQTAQSSAYNLVLQTLAPKSPTLHDHIHKNLKLEPGQYLNEIFTSLFTAHLAIDEAARLWDVYVFEGDGLLIRAAVALLLRQEMALLGTKSIDEFNAILGRGENVKSSARAVAESGAEDKFMTLVRGAGKV